MDVGSHGFLVKIMELSLDRPCETIGICNEICVFAFFRKLLAKLENILKTERKKKQKAMKFDQKRVCETGQISGCIFDRFLCHF